MLALRSDIVSTVDGKRYAKGHAMWGRERITTAARDVAASYWTAPSLGVAALALHVRWYVVDRPAGGEVVSGFGAALVVVGILVAARPFLRIGLEGLVAAAVPSMVIGRMPYGGEAEAIRQRQEAGANARRDIIAERVIAVLVIVLGTLLNGYGPLIARLCGLRV